MRDVFVLGSFTTPFRRAPEKTHHDLTREALEGVLADAGIEASRIDATYFGSAALHVFGQPNIGGQVLLLPLAREGKYPNEAPITNVEGGCATGGLALMAARAAVASGDCEVALALGVEKVFLPEAPQKMWELFEGGTDRLRATEARALYAEKAAFCGGVFEPHPARITILDAVALEASWHMARYGTTKAQLAYVASKNHAHGVKNPNAQYREAMSVEAVLADKGVVGPFTRSMCAPISDGAAAVLVGSREALLSLGNTRPRVRVAAIAAANGTRTSPDMPSVTTFAAKKAFAKAKLTPSDVHLAEVHDATAFAEIAATEDLGLCAAGEGGAFAVSGATSHGGRVPVNLSGGLESKGHPLAASGLAMAHELTLHLTGRAEERQSGSPSVGLFHNAGGLVGFDEATAVVGLLVREG